MSSGRAEKRQVRVSQVVGQEVLHGTASVVGSSSQIWAGNFSFCAFKCWKNAKDRRAKGRPRSTIALNTLTRSQKASVCRPKPAPPLKRALKETANVSFFT